MWRLIVVGMVIHVMLAAYTSTDLFTRSRRSNKYMWFVLLIAVPFVGVLLYERTKKRKRNTMRWG